MKLKKFPIQNILCVFHGIVLGNQIESDIKKISRISSLAKIVTISIGDLHKEDLEKYDMILVEGCSLNYSRHESYSSKALSFLLHKKQCDKILIITFNPEAWVQTSERLNIPIIYMGRIMGGIGEEIMEQIELYHQSEV